MDALKTTIRPLAAALAATLITGGLAGCKSNVSVSDEGGVRTFKRNRAGKRGGKSAPLVISGDKNKFVVEDDKGRPIMEAKVKRVDGMVQSGEGLQGPVKMLGADCRLYENGKPSMDMQSDEATWDGEQLTTQKPAHGVTADKKTIIDARLATWTAESGNLDLTDAKLQAMKNGKLDFTTEGPKAHVANQIVLMPAGSTSRNPEGQQMTADKVRWFMRSGKLEADGRVVLIQEGARVTGQRLRADTRLKQGRMSGGARVQLKQVPKRRKNG